MRTCLQASVGAEPISAIAFNTESAGNIQIPQISIASLLREHRISKLDILHCDTQGAETAIIRSCEALFCSKAIHFGIFSTHSHHISGDPLMCQRCLAMLRDFGGTILAEHDVHESFSGDGLIAAYFGREPLEWNEHRSAAIGTPPACSETRCTILPSNCHLQQKFEGARKSAKPLAFENNSNIR